MKKLFLVVVVLVGFNVATFAQGAHLGFKAGINFADFNSGNLDVDSRTGFHIGLVAELRLSDNFAIQPEAVYSSQGVELAREDLKIDYINIPVLVDIKIFKAVSLQLGPQFGFKVNEDEIESIGDLNDLDLGGAAGLEVKIFKLFAQARYNFGLTDVIDTANPPTNAVFQLSVGFNFF